MRTRRRWAGLLAAGVVLLVATVVFGLGGVHLVRADGDGLVYEAHYTYTIDPGAGTVHVIADVTLTNTVPNRSDSRGVLKTYFKGFRLPIPDEAVDVAATQDSTPVGVDHGDEQVGGHVYLGEIAFVRDLFFNQHARIHVTYDVAGSPPRSDDPTRSNLAYVAFDAFGVADPGRLTIDVVVPIAFDATTVGPAMERRVDGDDQVYSATEFDDGGSFDAFVIARRDDQLISDEHDLPGAKFVVRSWPGDGEWTAFVEDHLDRGVPALTTLIGEPWPVGSPVDVTEAATNRFFGYAGWFDAVNQELEVGEELDANTMLHELSHAWFNDDWFAGRWIDEGLAQEYADLAGQQLGEPATAPDEIIEAANTPLNAWVVPPDATTDDGQRSERIGYNASWYVIDQLVDSVGQDEMRDVFAAVAGDEIAYVGDTEPETVTGVTDWRRLLDLLQQRHGSSTAEDLFRTYVVTDAQRDELDRRDTARTQYAALVTAGGGWSAPLVVRRSMASWSFEDATGQMDAAGDTLAARDTLTSTLDRLGVTIDPDIETTYEGETTDFQATTAAIGAEQATADHVAATRDQAVAAVTAQGLAPTPGLQTVLRAQSTLTSEQAAADEVIAAAAVVQQAADAAATSRGWIDRVGLYGTDVDAIVRAARDALAAGDTTTARAEAAEARAVLADAHTTGRHRIVTAAVIAAVILIVLIVLVILIVLMRRRRRRSSPEADLAGSSADHATGRLERSVDSP